jgi:perosamine synthetase
VAFGGVNKWHICKALGAEGIPAGGGLEVMNNYTLFRPTPENHPVAKLFPERFDFSKLDLPVARRAFEHEAIWLNQSIFLGDRAGVDDVVEAVRKVQQYAAELQV